MTTPPPLVMYVIYDHPRDYPHAFVVRMWEDDAPRELPFAIQPTLDDARATLPPGLHRIDRHPFDDAVIVEVWL